MAYQEDRGHQNKRNAGDVDCDINLEESCVKLLSLLRSVGSMYISLDCDGMIRTTVRESSSVF